MASNRSTSYVRVKWGGNNSKRYDGKEGAVPKSTIVKEDGKNVEVMWGKRLWFGEIVEEKPAEETAPPAKKVKLGTKPSPKAKKQVHTPAKFCKTSGMLIVNYFRL